MSIIVKGMKMPTNCAHCLCCDESGRYCAAANEYIPMLCKPKWCPLVEVPTPHGRLVDADVLCEDLLGRWSVAETRKEDLIKAVMADVVTPIIACQPTIVESEDGT